MAPIVVTAQPDLHNYGGRLVSGGSRGIPVHAAAFLRRRELVLESALLRQPRQLGIIFCHELFHFVWMRLAHPHRLSWQALLHAERQARARGELGESASVAKAKLDWPAYVCESFCDTGASLTSLNGRDWGLADRWLARRRAWWRANQPPQGWRC